MEPAFLFGQKNLNFKKSNLWPLILINFFRFHKEREGK